MLLVEGDRLTICSRPWETLYAITRQPIMRISGKLKQVIYTMTHRRRGSGRPKRVSLAPPPNRTKRVAITKPLANGVGGYKHSRSGNSFRFNTFKVSSQI